MRLNKYIALCGYCSRRKADELISDGQVKINGERITELGYTVKLEENPKITVGNTLIKIPNQNTTIILNKPAGYTCTKKTFPGEENIYSLLPREFQKLNYAGRLDKDSSGLIILSDDGNLIQKLTHPSQKSFKKYQLLIQGNLSEENAKKFCQGINLEEGMTLPAQLEMLKSKGKNTEVLAIIQEGRKRQLKRMFAKLGHKVLKLHRLAMGDIVLPDNLKDGEWMEIRL